MVADSLARIARLAVSFITAAFGVGTCQDIRSYDFRQPFGLHSRCCVRRRFDASAP